MAIVVIALVVILVLVFAIIRNFSRPAPPAMYQDPYAPMMPGPVYVEPVDPLGDVAAFVATEAIAETVFDAAAMADQGPMDMGGFDGDSGGGFDSDF